MSHEGREEKRIAALRSIIPLIDSHLDLINRVRSALGSIWESEPSSLDVPRRFTVPGPELHCNMQCAVCSEAVYCKDELWVRYALELRYRYRLDAVTESIERLAGMSCWGAIRARAVYWELINHWDDWNPSTRVKWCDEGLRWLQSDIKGSIRSYRAGEEHDDARRNRNDEIVRLRENGMSFHAIAKRVGCSKNTVRAVLGGKKLVRGKLV